MAGLAVMQRLPSLPHPDLQASSGRLALPWVLATKQPWPMAASSMLQPTHSFTDTLLQAMGVVCTTRLALPLGPL